MFYRLKQEIHNFINNGIIIYEFDTITDNKKMEDNMNENQKISLKFSDIMTKIKIKEDMVNTMREKGK